MVKDLQASGAGEIVINSIDNDGLMNGYNISLIEKIMNVVDIPITAVGGAGTLSDIEELFRLFGLIGACAGSLFVYKGVYRAVLINYPTAEEKQHIFDYGNHSN